MLTVILHTCVCDIAFARIHLDTNVIKTENRNSSRGVLYLVVCGTGFNANASAAIGQQKLDVCVVTNRWGFSALARARLERA